MADGIDRRKVLRGAAVGAGLFWSAPAVKSVRMLTSAPGTPAPPTTTETTVPVPVPVLSFSPPDPCDPAFPFGTGPTHASHLAPNTQFSLWFAFLPLAPSFILNFTTDANGDASLPGVTGAQPFGIAVRIVQFTDHISGTTTFDEPCAGGAPIVGVQN